MNAMDRCVTLKYHDRTASGWPVVAVWETDWPAPNIFSFVKVKTTGREELLVYRHYPHGSAYFMDRGVAPPDLNLVPISEKHPLDKPKLRPWREEEIPFDAWFRRKGAPVYTYRISSFRRRGEDAEFAVFLDGHARTPGVLLSEWEWCSEITRSGGPGNQWEVCGITE